jgi:hypothetical protein
MKTIAKRFKEPSTWAGLAALATLFGVPLEHINAVTALRTAAAGALAVFLPEKGGQ